MNKHYCWKIISLMTVGVCFVYFFVINEYTPLMGEDYALAVFPKDYDNIGRMDKINFIIIKIGTQMRNWNVRLGEQISIIFSCCNKFYFNLCNSIITILFFWLIFQYAFKRKFIFGKKAFFYCILIFTLVIAFQPVLGEIFFWRTGSTNYLWAVCILLFWGLPVRYYIGYESIDIIGNNKYKLIFFTILGFFAGFTNENTVLFFLMLYIFIISGKEKICSGGGGGGNYLNGYILISFLF